MSQDTLSPVQGIGKQRSLLESWIPLHEASMSRSLGMNSSLSTARMNSSAQLTPEPAYTPSKPTLQPPSEPKKKTLAEAFVAIVENIHETSTTALEFDNERIDALTERMINQQKMRVEKLKETAEAATQRDTWSYLQMIASSILSAAAIIAGIASCSTFTPVGIAAGSLMIAGGSGSLASSVMTYTRFDPTLTAGLAFASAGLSLAGGGLSYFVLAHQLPQLITTILKSSVGVADGIATGGMQYKEMMIAYIEEELTKINLQLATEELKMQGISENSSETVSLIEVEQQVSNALANYQRSVKELNRVASQAV